LEAETRQKFGRALFGVYLQQFRFLAKVNLVLGKSEGRENWPSLATASKRLQRCTPLTESWEADIEATQFPERWSIGWLGGGGAPSKKVRRLR